MSHQRLWSANHLHDYPMVFNARRCIRDDIPILRGNDVKPFHGGPAKHETHIFTQNGGWPLECQGSPIHDFPKKRSSRRRAARVCMGAPISRTYQHQLWSFWEGCGHAQRCMYAARTTLRMNAATCPRLVCARPSWVLTYGSNLYAACADKPDAHVQVVWA